MSLDIFRLDGRVALVTGSSRGLGLAMAQALAGVGANVVINSRGAGEAQLAAQAIAESTGSQTLALAADVTQAEEVEALIRETLAAFGRIDVVVNNAGMNLRKPLADVSDEEWDAMQNLLLRAPFLCCRAVAPYMKAAGYGRVINVSSMIGQVGLGGRSAYCSAKGGLIQLTRTLALEWAPYGITVNALCPGPFATELSRPAMDDPKTNRFILDRIPLGRWGAPRELAGAILFLASDASSYMTGSCLTVDGGWTAA